MRHIVAGLLVGLMLTSLTLLPAAAQRGTPQRAAPAEEGARGGEANRAGLAAVPRAPDGKPDLRGSWIAPRLYNSNILEEHPAGFGIDAGRSVVIDPPDGKIPYQPWALAQRDENRKAENAYLDNQGRCYFSGVPRIMLFSFDVEYAANQIVLFSDYVHTTRFIHMDRRTHVPSAIRFWMGDSIGAWDGDTLVVDTSNFNGKFWFALGGDFATDALTSWSASTCPIRTRSSGRRRSATRRSLPAPGPGGGTSRTGEERPRRWEKRPAMRAIAIWFT